jgi:hypothetical protein
MPLGGARVTDAEQGGRRPANAQVSGGSGITFNTTCNPYHKPPGTEATPAQSGTSIFDPVLCELAYRWFSPPGCLVLDPFAGGSVRGIVAAKCGREYFGVDLRPEQVAANEAQAARICGEGIAPLWRVGDSAAVIPALDVEADFVFSCPPYGDL